MGRADLFSPRWAKRERGEMFCILIATLTFAEIIRRRRSSEKEGSAGIRVRFLSLILWGNPSLFAPS